LVQDHERIDVARVRVVVVKKVLELFPRMFIYRRVDFGEAKKHAPKLDTKSVGPEKGNAEALAAGLGLHKMKDEAPNEKELKLVADWASQRCDGSVWDIIEGSTDEHVVVEADKLDYVEPATGTLGPLQTQADVPGKWEDGRFQLFCSETGDDMHVTDDENRPLVVWMHDECTFRHEDVGRCGWSFKKMASQRHKDDSSGARPVRPPPPHRFGGSSIYFPHSRCNAALTLQHRSFFPLCSSQEG
jgi:hypothetical protein